MGLYASLGDGEKFVKIGGYYGPRAEKPNGHNNWDQYMKQVAWSLHETVIQTIRSTNKSFSARSDKTWGRCQCCCDHYAAQCRV